MNPATDYKPEQSFALMLIGPPKAGKTTFALNFPDPYILDCDNNLAGALRYHNHSKNPIKFWFDNPGNEPLPEKRWGFCVKALKEAVQHPEVKTIFVDGLTLMAYYLEKHILANSTSGGSNAMKDLIIAGEKCMNMSHWMPFKNLMSQLVMACKCSGKLFVMSCHEQTEHAESGAVIGYSPLISGSLRQNIAGYFTDVWRCETNNTPTGADYSVRFVPRSLMQIGNSLNIKDKDMKVTGLTRAQVWAKLSTYLQLPTTLVS
jgi:hypothetical protein